MKNPISPKVWTSVIVTLVLGSLVAALGAVTPGMLSALGAWAPVLFAAITALGVGLSSYVVTDQVRDTGVSALAIHRSIAAAAPDQGPVLNISVPDTGAVASGVVPGADEDDENVV